MSSTRPEAIVGVWQVSKSFEKNGPLREPDAEHAAVRYDFRPDGGGFVHIAWAQFPLTWRLFRGQLRIRMLAPKSEHLHAFELPDEHTLILLDDTGGGHIYHRID